MRYESFKLVETRHWYSMMTALAVATLLAIFSTYYAYKAKMDSIALRDVLQFAIAKHNKLNHDLISANERIAELQSANEALIGAGLK